jgi:hypothetical protein
VDRRNRGDRDSAYEQGRQDALAEMQRNNAPRTDQPVSNEPVPNEPVPNEPMSHQPRPLGWHDAVSSPPPPPPAGERPTQP